MAETAEEIVPLWEQWDAAGRPIPPCPACGGPATHTAWTEGYNEGGPIADCDATRCDCGLQIRGYATCADATNMSGFQWWLLATRFERQAAEITRLQSGGCARYQTTTQYCAEAAKFAAEIAELRAEVESLREAAADQGSRLIRLQLALKIIREHGTRSYCWDRSVAFAIANWIDANDAGQPIPWIDSPFFEQWAAENGLSNVNGFIGYMAAARIAEPPAPESSDA